MTNLNENLFIWDEYQATDPNYTKQGVKVSGQIRVCADAQYKKRQITKAFGPMGKGWGVIADSEKYERVNYPQDTVLLSYSATVFYLLDGEKYFFPIAAAIKEAQITDKGKGYLKIDDEAVKKVRTDALTKGFTDLGFCADIHMGMFDDNTYVIAAFAKAEIEKEGNTEEVIAKAKEEISVWVKNEIESCKKILPKNPTGFKAAMAGVKKKMITRCNAVNINSTPYAHRLDQVIIEELDKIEKEGQQNGTS
jgi:hypothetical protein